MQGLFNFSKNKLNSKLNILKKLKFNKYTRKAGIEPTMLVLKTKVLPLNYSPKLY